MNDEKILALTFDDGPNTTTTCEVLDILEKYNVTASFFVCGDNIDSETAEVMRRAVKMGCEIQNHSRTHSDMTKMTKEEILQEVVYTSDAVEKAVGKRPEFFRPPYIAVNELMFENIELTFIQGAGAEDYLDEVSAEERCKRIIAQAKDGMVLLLHDAKGNFRTVKALDMIIPKLKEDGFRMVTISELFKERSVSPQHGILYTNVFQKERYYH